MFSTSSSWVIKTLIVKKVRFYGTVKDTNFTCKYDVNLSP